MIAGTLRGRSLGAPPPGVRPTSDRVRESVFGCLGELSGARVLDLFAGTGALGIEALSRGAESVVAVDRAGRSVAALEKNLAKLDISDRVRVIRTAAGVALRRLVQEQAAFDLVFLDPPYDAGLVEPTLRSLAEAGVLAEGAVVVVETAKRHPVPPVEGFEVRDVRTYGDTTVTWLGVVPEVASK